jgi:hypothetical protein
MIKRIKNLWKLRALIGFTMLNALVTLLAWIIKHLTSFGLLYGMYWVLNHYMVQEQLISLNAALAIYIGFRITMNYLDFIKRYTKNV